MTPADFQRICQAADGYLTLGLLGQAWNALEDLPPRLKETEEVISLQIEILLKSNQPLKASFLAEALALLLPDDPEILVLVAECKMHAADISGALHWLAEIEPRCAASAAFHLLRAKCYAAHGLRAEARAALERTFALDPALRAEALDDPALAMLW